jgi:hypothetical protein
VNNPNVCPTCNFHGYRAFDRCAACLERRAFEYVARRIERRERIALCTLKPYQKN